MKTWMKKMVQLGGLFSLLSCNQPVDVVTIDLSKKRPSLLPWIMQDMVFGIVMKEC